MRRCRKIVAWILRLFRPISDAWKTRDTPSRRLKDEFRIYSARTKARTVIRETVDDLVNRLFAGDTMPLMRHLIEERGIGEKELTELREMLDRLEKQGCDE